MADNSDVPWYQSGLDLLGESVRDIAHAEVKGISSKLANPHDHKQSKVIDQFGNDVPYPLRTNPDLNKSFFEKNKTLIVGGGVALVSVLLIVVAVR